MNEKQKGINVAKGESAFEAIQNAIPHWIHDKKEDPTSVTGFLYLRSCRCSVCGCEVSFERPKCPHCGTDMQHMKGLAD